MSAGLWLYVALGGYAVVVGVLVAAARADRHIAQLLAHQRGASWTS